MMTQEGEDEKMQTETNETDVGVGILTNLIQTFDSTPHLSVSWKFRTGNNESVNKL
jgi:hypothetical protein